MKKIIFLVVILLFAISSAKYTVLFLSENNGLAAIALLLTVIFGSFFVQEVAALEKDVRSKSKSK